MLFKIIFVAALLKCTTAAAKHTQVETEFRTPIEKQYRLEYFYKANWQNAYKFCRYHGLQLATIETKEQQNYLSKLIVDSGFGKEFFWTSGQDQDKERQFSWFSTGNLFKYTNWDANQPDNYLGNENCMHLWHNQKWNDIACSNQYYFICEKPEETVHCHKSCC